MSPVEFAQTVEGWMNELELMWLSRTASSLKPGAVWLEVGTWMGRSWSCAALSLPADSTIIAVDTFLGENAEPLQWVREHGSAMSRFMQTHEVVREKRPDLLSQILAVRSTEAARLVPDGLCDVVFIDGDHRTEFVKSDIKAWRPKLKPGGILCGHDFSDQNVVNGLKGHHYRNNQKTMGSIWCL